MEIGDGADGTKSVRISKIYKGRTPMVLVEIGFNDERIVSVEDACRLLEVLYGCEESSRTYGKRPIHLAHQLEPVPAYVMRDADESGLASGCVMLQIMPHQAVWLRLVLEQIVASCND